MNRFLLTVFVVIPFVEIWLLIWAGRWMGAGNVLLSLLASALFGVFMIRREGARTLEAIKERVARGEMPGDELLDGTLLLIAGGLMIVPGFLSDLVGLIILLPWTRSFLRQWLISLLEGKIRAAAFRGDPANMVIEGEALQHPDKEF